MIIQSQQCFVLIRYKKGRKTNVDNEKLVRVNVFITDKITIVDRALRFPYKNIGEF